MGMQRPFRPFIEAILNVHVFAVDDTSALCPEVEIRGIVFIPDMEAETELTTWADRAEQDIRNRVAAFIAT
jgi:hypothetical protein